MKYLKYFESILNEDIKDQFYDLIDLGCTYTHTNNSIELKKDNPSMSEFMPEVERIFSRLVDSQLEKILDIELVLKPSRFLLKLNLKTSLYLNITVGNENNKLKLISVKKNSGTAWLHYEIKLLNEQNKISTLKVILFLGTYPVGITRYYKYDKNRDIDIEFTFNNRKKGIKIDLKEFVDVLEQYDPNIELIPYIKKALDKQGLKME